MKNQIGTEVCYRCGGTMRRGTVPECLAYEGLTAHFDSPAWICSEVACGEVICNGADIQFTIDQRDALIVRAEAAKESAVR